MSMPPCSEQVDLEYTVAMSGRRDGDGVRLVGTVAIVAGGGILAVSARSGVHVATYLFSALLVVGGLFLRIEAAVLRAGDASDPPDESSGRPWHRDPEEPEPEAALCGRGQTDSGLPPASGGREALCLW